MRGNALSADSNSSGFELPTLAEGAKGGRRESVSQIALSSASWALACGCLWPGKHTGP